MGVVLAAPPGSRVLARAPVVAPAEVDPPPVPPLADGGDDDDAVRRGLEDIFWTREAAVDDGGEPRAESREE